MMRHVFPDSHHVELQPHLAFPKCHPHEQIEVTCRLAIRQDDALRALAEWAFIEKLRPTELNARKGVAKFCGAVEDMEAAFGVELHVRELPNGSTHRAHFGPISVPESMAAIVSSVHGLDDRPVATPRIKKSAWACGKVVCSVDGTPEGSPVWYNPADEHSMVHFDRPPGTFTPLQVADLYHFPPGDGHGQTIALIELGGGSRQNDLRAYWSYLGIQGPNVVSVGVNGGRNEPGSDADSEVMLDIEVAGSIAPKATIACYFGGNSARDFLDAITEAVHDQHLKPSIVSISWGGPEDSWTVADMTAMNAIFEESASLGITVLVAAGDNGSSDGETGNHCDFPASSPFVTGCGGTRITAANGAITSEVVWNDTADGDGSGGGGCSVQFPKLAWQPETPCGTMRAVPDVAGLADPETGYCVRVDGQMTVVGGTSAVAPLLAGLIARCNQITGKRAAFLNPTLYSRPSVCNDVTVGNNGSFAAQVGYDCATGLGSINGTRLLEVLQTP